jgi:hypothetical protein
MLGNRARLPNGSQTFREIAADRAVNPDHTWNSSGASLPVA